MFDLLFGFVCGVFFGFGIRIVYYLITGKDIPLLK